MKALVFLLAVLLAGCATPYGDAGITGGHSASPVNQRLLKVSFSGNGFITADKVQTYALYRCAELARDAKKPYFVLYDSLGAAARDVPSPQPTVGTLGGKPIAFGFVSMEDTYRTGAHETTATLDRLAPLVTGPVQPAR